MLKCDRATIKEYIKRHPELEQVEEEARERSIDLAESVVMRQMQKENLTAAIFMLNTQGKKRGYSTKQDVEVTGEIKVVLQNDLADQDSEPV